MCHNDPVLDIPIVIGSYPILDNGNSSTLEHPLPPNSPFPYPDGGKYSTCCVNEKEKKNNLKISFLFFFFVQIRQHTKSRDSSETMNVISFQNIQCTHAKLYIQIIINGIELSTPANHTNNQVAIKIE